MTDTKKEVEGPMWEMTEDVVISGISGRFPESDNMDELSENLLANKDLVTEDDRRWPLGLYGLPSRAGKIKDLSKFDAQFFGVHGKQANLMDPQARLLLELTYEAICDAGMNPHTLRGSRTGVYVGACVSEVEEGLAQDVSKVSGYALTGCSRSMFANRISYTFDFQGPSYAMDTACSSSFLAFQQAILGLRSGQCDQAIVGGVNICLRPVTALQFHKLGLLSDDGKCKFLDASASGYARSEACSVVFLQKRSESKRIYATVIHSKTNTDGYKPEGITYPSKRAQIEIMSEVCAEADVDPKSVAYIEANGLGSAINDPCEADAIAKVYCPEDRPSPLLVGSVKTNLGHPEPASGLCSLAKVLIAFERKSIPASLHFETPNADIESLASGVLVPVTKNTPFDGGIAGVNSFGFGGVNVHVLVKSNEKELDTESFQVFVDKLPRLIQVCGRTEASVNHIFDEIEADRSKVTREFLALLNEMSKIPASAGMNYRGLMLFKPEPEPEVNPEGDVEPFKCPREVARVPEKKPVWFVFSGMGSQWPSMARSLMAIPIFEKAVKECADVLKPFGVDLLHLLLESDEKALDTTVAPFVSIAAVQIGLVSILRVLGIEPDGIVGHSVGELGCAFADGCFNAKQMILSAYWRGKCVEDHHCERGLMAAVGLTWDECKERCPPGVVPACHNSEDSVTISGPYDATFAFVEQLKSENIFARGVKSCDVAFHSPHVGPIGPSLLAKLKEILPEPVLRSPKWISSSVPEKDWELESCRYSAPQYYVNNLTSPVLFHAAVQKLPKNGIMIEIAPHTLLQAILKRSLGPDMSYVGLMKRNNDANQLDFLFSAIGKLYELGLNPCIEKLYPSVEWPVPRGVRSISSLVRWDHSQNWLVTQYPEYFNPSSSSDYVVKVNIMEPDDAFLADHVIDGRRIYPATGYLMLAWKMLAKIKGQFFDKIPVEFENVTIHRQTLLTSGAVKFVVRMMETSGEFSISEGSVIVASGRVFVPEDPVLKMQDNLETDSQAKPDLLQLAPKEIYRELRIRGYDYQEKFQGLLEAREDGRRGLLRWTGNWISFADACLQLATLGSSSRSLMTPVRFQCVRCDPRILLDLVEKESQLPVAMDPRIALIVTKGLEIRGVKSVITPRRRGTSEPILEKHLFVANDEPRLQHSKLDAEETNEYHGLCGSLAKNLATKNGLKLPFLTAFEDDVNQSLLDRYLNGSPTEFALLHTLADIAESKAGTKISEKISKAVLRHRRDLAKDLLANGFIRERFLRPSLDIVSENQKINKQLHALEVNASTMALNQSVKSYLELELELPVNYTIASPRAADLGIAIRHEVDAVLDWNVHFQPADKFDFILYKDNQITTNGTEYGALAARLDGLITENGFVLGLFRNSLSAPEMFLFERKSPETLAKMDEFIAKSKALGFAVISVKSDANGFSSVLLRKKRSQPKKHVVVKVTSKSEESIRNALTADVQSNVWLIAEDAPKSGLLGLVKCLRREDGGDRLRCLFGLSSKLTLTNELLEKDLVMNVMSADGLGSYRHLSMQRVEEDGLVDTPHAYLNITKIGDLSSFKWFQQAPPDGKLCSVYYAPLNQRDLLLATGAIPAADDAVLGMEFSGRDSSGRRVMGMVPGKGLATSVSAGDSDFLWPVPEHWTLAEASTVPVAYATAYYALIVRGGLQPGESTLIHSGDGAIGQAAISVALSMGCEVFTTVASKEKMRFVREQFPSLDEKHFASSLNTSFEQHVLRQTKGRGVDVVLNSLSDERLQASVRCLAQHGRFLEIGKYDLSVNNPIGMSAFLRNIAFHGIKMDMLLNLGSSPPPAALAQKAALAALIKEGIATGAVKPIVHRAFQAREAEAAFRHFASADSVGKVVLKIRDEESTKMTSATPVTLKAVARTAFSAARSYLINGGQTALGMELATWMVERGARKLVLGPSNARMDSGLKLSLKRLQLVANIICSKNEANSSSGAKKLVAEASGLGPIGGVFHLPVDSKIDAAKNLDQVTRSESNLEYFVVFSSQAAGRGEAGADGFDDSWIERLVEERRRTGLPGTAIQWGAIGDIDDNRGQRIPSVMNALDRFLQAPVIICSSFVRDANKKSVSKVRPKDALVTLVAHILRLKKNVSESVTLAELGLDELLGVEIRQTLERDHDLIMSTSEVSALTVHQIKQISLGNLSVLSEPEEAYLARSLPVVSIPGADTLALNDVRDGKPVFFLPSIDGTFDQLAPLAKLLKRPAIGVHWTKSMAELDDLVQIASHQLQVCRRVLVNENELLDVIGHSFGALCALQMAAEGGVGELILLDGAPEQLQFALRGLTSFGTANGPVELDAERLSLFLQQLLDMDMTETRVELTAISDPEVRITRAVEIYVDHGGPPQTTPEAFAFAATAFHKKLGLVQRWSGFEEPLKMDAMLIRAEELSLKIMEAELSQDYGVSSLVAGETTIRTMKGSHRSVVLANLKAIAAVINTKL